MKHLFVISVFLTLTLLSGCTLFQTQDSKPIKQLDIHSQLDQWLKQHEYAKALDLLASLDKSHPDYRRLLKQKTSIHKAAEKFETAKLNEIKGKIRNKNWLAAEKSINYSLKKLPDSKALHKLQHEFIKKRALHLQSLYYQLSINKAEWLVKNKDVQKELSQTLPDQEAAHKAMARHKAETEQVYRQLIECGIEGTNIGDLEQAEQCYVLANELKPDPELKSSIQDIQQKLLKGKKPQTVKLSKPARQILNQAKDAMSSGKLKYALNLHRSISVPDQGHALVRAFKQELDSRIKENVASQIEMGRKLYSQGEIKQALAVWKNVHELDPDNEYLLNHIERAQKVIDKLEELKQQKSTVKPPGTGKKP